MLSMKTKEASVRLSYRRTHLFSCVLPKREPWATQDADKQRRGREMTLPLVREGKGNKTETIYKNSQYADGKTYENLGMV